LIGRRVFLLGFFQESTQVANIASAEKTNRQRIKRRARNQGHLTTLRTYVKRVRTAIESKDSGKATSALKEAVSVIDKAAGKGVIKRETAARKISRLTLAVQKLSA
jgi:small subunit ribosomal protein S20